MEEYTCSVTVTGFDEAGNSKAIMVMASGKHSALYSNLGNFCSQKFFKNFSYTASVYEYFHIQILIYKCASSEQYIMYHVSIILYQSLTYIEVINFSNQCH